MKVLGGRFAFPETREEAATWDDEQLIVRGLHMYVIAVAKLRIEGTWSCYIMPCVDHTSHEVAARCLWRTDGARVESEELARVLFPQLDAVPYAR